MFRKIISIIFVLFFFLTTFPVNATQNGTSTNNKVKKKLNPFSVDNNYGYDNSYLNWYLTGRINTPPPFGGSIQQIIFCEVEGIRWTAVGPPRPGWYLWTPGVTRTYPFGPPTHTGQWLLGLYAPKYFCVITIQPINMVEGIEMTMMGSSQ